MPWHVCPTVALHAEAVIVRDGRAVDRWPIRARGPPPHGVVLSLIIAFAIVALVVLIARVRLHAFLALMLVSAVTGLAAGLPPAVIAGAFQEGVGSTLGFTAVVISLGAIFGKLLADSGGASVVARAITGAFGADALPWAVAAAGFLVGLPVFFSVGLVLLVPVVWEIASVSGRPFLSLALPLVAGLSASHGLVAPHPGPIAAIERLGADPGKSIVYGILAGLACDGHRGATFHPLRRTAPGGRG